MTLTNTPQTYGAVARALHWLTALLILTLLPLGLIANRLPYATSAELMTKAQVFSIHKTLGVTLFLVALLRIVWALSQTRPGLLHPERHWESFAARAVHWVLYGALVIVPLSGWIHHAATAGFAPIWGPFGQKLPFVPLSEPVAEAAATAHRLFTKVLMAALALHIAGALKHHLIERDGTLRRMVSGKAAETPPPQRHGPGALLAAALLWGLAGGTALMLAAGTPHQGTASLLEKPTDTGWTVQNGTISLSVKQLGSAVTGGFADWTAAIDFTETATGNPDATGKHGRATVTIAMDSVTIGSVTTEAKDASFFDVANHPTAIFDADLIGANGENAYFARGTLTLKGITLPLTLPFTLTIAGDTATAQGKTIIDRRDFRIGIGQDDEATLAFDVEVTIALTAKRTNG